MSTMAPRTPNRKTVLIMAAGTGGHIFPALSIADYLLERGYSVEWLGTRKGMEVQVLQGTAINLNFLSVNGLRGKGIGGLLMAPFMLLQSTWQAIALLRKVDPCCVLGMGGYVTGPGGVAAKLTGRKLLIHEQNAIAGFSNKLLARIADHVMQAFPETFKPSSKLQTTGNPVRKEIHSVCATKRASASAKIFRILVLGGSLGAVAINKVIPQMLGLFPATERPQILHQTGKNNLLETQALYKECQLHGIAEFRVEPFITDMASAYSQADIVICRAGALTLSELTVAGVPSILVPFPHAVDDHQTRNAESLSKAGAAVLMPQPELNAEHLYQTITKLMRDRSKLESMAAAALALAQPDATELVAKACMEACDAA